MKSISRLIHLSENSDIRKGFQTPIPDKLIPFIKYHELMEQHSGKELLVEIQNKLLDGIDFTVFDEADLSALLNPYWSSSLYSRWPCLYQIRYPEAYIIYKHNINERDYATLGVLLNQYLPAVFDYLKPLKGGGISEYGLWTPAAESSPLSFWPEQRINLPDTIHNNLIKVYYKLDLKMVEFILDVIQSRLDIPLHFMGYLVKVSDYKSGIKIKSFRRITIVDDANKNRIHFLTKNKGKRTV